MNLPKFTSLICIASTCCALVAHAVILVDGDTVDWTPIIYPGTESDYLDDEQTGINEYDIVGTSSHPGFYTQFDNGGDDTSLTDGEIAFRFRLGGNKNPSYFEGYAWVGMDVNSDGALDLFVGADNPSATSWNITIHDAGTGENISPNTTSINSTAIYSSSDIAGEIDWASVTSSNDSSATNFDIDNDDPDYFFSFKLDFSELVAAVNTLMPSTNFDENSAIAYVAATATQVNTLNADLNGVNADLNSTSTWEALNALSPEVSADGTPIVPEPKTYALVLGMLAVCFTATQRKRS